MTWRTLIMSLGVVLGCAGDPVSDEGGLVGPYEAVTFTTFEQGLAVDRIQQGAVIVVRLLPGGSVAGGAFISDWIAGGGDYDVEFTGTWRRAGDFIRVDVSGSSFLDDTPLEIRENGILSGRYSGVGVAHPPGDVDSLYVEFAPRLE